MRGSNIYLCSRKRSLCSIEGTPTFLGAEIARSSFVLRALSPLAIQQGRTLSLSAVSRVLKY